MRDVRVAMRWAVAGGAVLGLMMASPAMAIDFLTSGHTDVEILYDDVLDEWEFEILCEECSINGVPIPGDEEFETDSLKIAVKNTTLTTAVGDVGPFNDLPTGATPGNDFWKLPESEVEADAENVPFLGWGRDEIGTGIFVGDEIVLELIGITYMGAAGSAEFSMYSTDAGIGGQIPHFWHSTFDPSATVNGDNTIDLAVGPGTHTHYNLGFTEEGMYEIEYAVSGDLVAGGSTSGTGTLLFQVPEPGTGVLLACALLGFTVRSRRAASRRA